MYAVKRINETRTTVDVQLCKGAARGTSLWQRIDLRMHPWRRAGRGRVSTVPARCGGDARWMRDGGVMKSSVLYDSLLFARVVQVAAAAALQRGRVLSIG